MDGGDWRCDGRRARSQGRVGFYGHVEATDHDPLRDDPSFHDQPRQVHAGEAYAVRSSLTQGRRYGWRPSQARRIAGFHQQPDEGEAAVIEVRRHALEAHALVARADSEFLRGERDLPAEQGTTLADRLSGVDDHVHEIRRELLQVEALDGLVGPLPGEVEADVGEVHTLDADHRKLGGKLELPLQLQKAETLVLRFLPGGGGVARGHVGANAHVITAEERAVEALLADQPPDINALSWQWCAPRLSSGRSGNAAFRAVSVVTKAESNAIAPGRSEGARG